MMTLGSLSAASTQALNQLLARYQLQLIVTAAQDEIPYSYWGAPEAGIRGQHVYARADTPIHSVLHEACHVICMDPARRECISRDALGDDAEECAVCYLQLLLADEIPSVGFRALAQDMDAWGYSFRCGSTAQWFVTDATDAQQWLTARALIDENNKPLAQLRGRTD